MSAHVGLILGFSIIGIVIMATLLESICGGPPTGDTNPSQKRVDDNGLVIVTANEAWSGGWFGGYGHGHGHGHGDGGHGHCGGGFSGGDGGGGGGGNGSC